MTKLERPGDDPCSPNWFRKSTSLCRSDPIARGSKSNNNLGTKNPGQVFGACQDYARVVGVKKTPQSRKRRTRRGSLLTAMNSTLRSPMRSTLVLLLIAAMCAVAMTPVHATVLGTVRGVVHDPMHRPIPAVQVELHARASDWSQNAPGRGRSTSTSFTAKPQPKEILTAEDAENRREMQKQHTDYTDLADSHGLSRVAQISLC